MARSKVRSRRRLKTYLGWLVATVGLILAACFAVNCLVDPLWYLRGNVLTENQLSVQRAPRRDHQDSAAP